MSKKIIIIGGVGNGSVVAHAITDANKRGYNEWECAGFLNDKISIGENIESYPVLGKIHDIQKFIDQGYYFYYSIFRLYTKQQRIELFYELNIPESQLATFIHPLAYVAPGVKLGPGCVVMPNASLSPSTTFGKCCGIMISSVIGHNIVIGDFCHFAGACCVGAFTKLEDGVNIGANATVREYLTLAKFSTVGMGAMLTKNTGENEIWIGNPARFYKKSD